MRRLALALVVVIVAAVGVANHATAASPDPFEVLDLVSFDSGIKAPAFTLPDLEGHPVALSAPQGSAALVVFWATW